MTNQQDTLLQELRANPELDVYDIGVRWLQANPGDIDDAWGSVGGSYPRIPPEAQALFQYAGPREPCVIGCLTQIKKGALQAGTSELTIQIASDDSIPCFGHDIKVEDLEHFADWQRYLDELYPGVDRGCAAEFRRVHGG